MDSPISNSALPILPKSNGPEKTILVRFTEREANELAFLMDTALKSPVGGLRVMQLVGKFMSKLSNEMESGIVAASPLDLPTSHR